MKPHEINVIDDVFMLLNLRIEKATLIIKFKYFRIFFFLKDPAKQK